MLSQTPIGGEQPTSEHLDTISCAELLLEVLGHTAGEFTSLLYEDTDGKPHTAVNPPAVAADWAPRLPGTANCYFGVNPVKGPARHNDGRGAEADVTRLAALVCDLDFKPGGCSRRDVAEAIIADLSILLGTRPSAIVDSGHGLHAYWPVSDGYISGAFPTPAARALLKRWGRLVTAVADQLGVHVDNVFDLARMMRLPGSRNNKNVNGAGAPLVTAYADTGGPLAVAEVDERLNEVGIYQSDDDTERDEEELSPPDEWEWAEQTCPYVAKMIDGWATDEPGPGRGRHPWLICQNVRLACAHRSRCITEADHERARDTLARRFTHIVQSTEPRRAPRKFEFKGAREYGIKKAAAKTDEYVRAELGDHTHGDTAWSGDAEHSGHGVALSDKGNADKLVAAYGRTIRYIPELSRWAHWTGVLWHIDPDTGAVDTAAAQIATTLPDNTKEQQAHRKQSLSVRGITGMVRLARSDPAMRITRDRLDADAYQLNTPSGIVDLRTGEISAHRPDAWHTRITGVAYQPDAACTMWEAFLNYTFCSNQELIGYIQKLAGAAAIGEVLHHLLPFFYGIGDNGKTVLLETLLRVLGDYAITAPANFLLAGRDKHETEIARLAGARFVVCSEINEGTRFDEAKVKLLTGGDKLTGRFMHGNFFDFRPTHTLFLMGNHQPAVGAGGHAFWRRLRLIPFTNQVPDDKKIDKLDARLIEREGPAILAWIVAGAKAVANGRLTEPDIVKAATGDYATSEDHIGQFISECTRRVTHEHRVPSGELYRRYTDWCKGNGMTPKASNVFSREISSRGYLVRQSHGRRYVHGIMLLDTSQTDPD